MATYNKLYETWFRGTNTIPATYGNVSLYTTGKSDLKGGITTTNLAINKNNTTYALDVSGNVNIDKNVNIKGNLDVIGDYVAILPLNNNPKQYGIAVDNTGFVASGTDLQYLLNATESSDIGNKFRITSFDGQLVKEYLKCEVNNYGSAIDRPISGTINGNLTIKTGTFIIDASANVSGFTKSMVGLGNVDNTSDANKPISTATQTALNLRAFDASCVHLTGNESISGTKTITGELVPTRNINSSTTAIGSGALQYRQATSLRNIGIGSNALQGNTTTPALNTGIQNIAIGENTLKLVEDASNNVIIGHNSAIGVKNNTRFNDNVVIGNDAFNTAVVSTGNSTGSVFIGNRTAQKLCSGTGNSNSNVGIGTDVMKNHTSGGGNTIIGFGANALTTGGSGSVAIGFSALGSATNTQLIMGLGSYAGENNASAYNTFVGIQSGRQTGGTAEQRGRNTFIGTEADIRLSMTGFIQNHTALGFKATICQNYPSIVMGGRSDYGLPDVFIPSKNRLFCCSTLSSASNAMAQQVSNDIGHCYGDTILLTSAVSSITLPRTRNGTEFNTDVVGGIPQSIGLRYTFVKNYESPLTSVSITPFNAFERILDLNSGSMLSSITMGTNIRSLSLVNVAYVLNPTSNYVSWICYSRDIDTTIFPQLSATNSFSGSNSFTSLPTSSATPTLSNQFTTKTYVDTAIAGSVPSGVAFLDLSNNFTQQNSFSGITRFTGDASFNNPVHLYGGLYAGHAGMTIHFGSNAPTMSGWNIEANTIPDSALTTNIPKKNGNSTFTGHNQFDGSSNFVGYTNFSRISISSSPQDVSGGITFPNTDLNRKIVLYPVVDNDFQNYSIGVNDTSGEMLFLLPDSNKTFNFGYGTSTTAKQDILTISEGSTNLYVGGGNNAFTIKNTSNQTILRVSPLQNEFRVSNGVSIIAETDFLFYSIDLSKNVMSISVQNGLLLDEGLPLIMKDANSNEYFTIDAVNGSIDISGVMEMNFKGDTRLNFCEPNTNTRVGGFYGADMDLSGGIITLTNQQLLKNNMYLNALNTDDNSPNGGTNISGAYTIPKPYSHFYGVQGTSVFTITLPTITSQDLGNEICFRRVSGTSNISFQANGTQKAYPNGSITGQTTSFVGLTSGTNTFVAFTAMKETGNTTYAWFAHL